jgi:hypothetical protein
VLSPSGNYREDPIAENFLPKIYPGKHRKVDANQSSAIALKKFRDCDIPCNIGRNL